MNPRPNSLPGRLAALGIGDSHYIEATNASKKQQEVQTILARWKKDPELRKRRFVQSKIVAVPPDLATFVLVRVTRGADKEPT